MALRVKISALQGRDLDSESSWVEDLLEEEKWQPLSTVFFPGEDPMGQEEPGGFTVP